MKNNKERLFEVMEKLNPDFKLKEGLFNKGVDAINTLKGNAQDVANQATMKAASGLTNNFRLETYGDLMKITNVIKEFKSGKIAAGSKLTGKGISYGIDALVGLFPGGGTLMTALKAGNDAIEIYADIFGASDDKKTGLWLDKLNLDDELSAIVDDTVESGFLNYLLGTFGQKNPDEQLPDNFDINAEMVQYLAQKYDNRTIAGVPARQ